MFQTDVQLSSACAQRKDKVVAAAVVVAAVVLAVVVVVAETVDKLGEEVRC